FDSFTPVDTMKIIDPSVKKTKVFFEDFFGKDSVQRKKAIASLWNIKLDSTDLPNLFRAINSFKWSEKKYLERKISFIEKLGTIPTKSASDFLKNVYYSAGDTLQLQHTALEALLAQQTQYSYNIFKDIITTEPPILDDDNSSRDDYYSPSYSYRRNYRTSEYGGGGFMGKLYDSLKLTRTILPGLLPLMTLDDYKQPIMGLLKQMVDSNLVTAKDYEMYFSKFLIEAKQALKKQSIAEKNSAIEKAEDAKLETKPVNTYYRRNNDEDTGNDELVLYATLLLPFKETNPVVNDVFKQLLSSNDKRLKYNTLYLFLQHKLPVPDTMLTYFAKMEIGRASCRER